MIDNEEAIDEMRIFINNKATRRILSSMVSKMVNNKVPIDLKVDVDSLMVDTLSDGNLEFRLAVKGTANKDAIFDLIGHKGGL